MGQLQRFDVQLPKVAIPMPPLEGEGLDHTALVRRDEHDSAAAAIVQFRARFAPEAATQYRRYYLEPEIRKGRATGRFVVKYVWNTSPRAKRSDKFVGVVGQKGDMPDFARAQLLIGAHGAGRCLPYAWHLCEDRDGENPLDMGRMDIFDLLRGVSEEDVVQFQAERGVAITPYDWDFYQWFWRTRCPGCKTRVSILMMAFDVDSAQCASCGIRPFLSRAIVPQLTRTLGSCTVGGDKEATDRLLHSIRWMGSVKAGVKNIHPRGLPEGMATQAAFDTLWSRSTLALTDRGASDGVSTALQSLRGKIPDGVFATAQAAVGVLAEAVKRGGPFTGVEKSMADMLASIFKDAGEPKLLTLG